MENHNQENLRQFYQALLMDLGYQSRIDTEGDVIFIHKDITLCIQIQEPEFCRIIFQGTYHAHTPQERKNILQTINATNAETTTTKCIPINETTLWITTETFCPEPGAIIPHIFPQLVETLFQTIHLFHTNLTKLTTLGGI